MVHSTASSGIMPEDWYEMWNVPNLSVCVHAFVGPDSIYQILPWDIRGWHCGRARKGGPSGNDTHISFEICEPPEIEYNDARSEIISYDPKSEENQRYFEKVWKNSVDLCVKLCKDYKIDPSHIISHQEGHEMGIASNHTDPKHWWDFHEKAMDDFRSEVSLRLQKINEKDS